MHTQVFWPQIQGSLTFPSWSPQLNATFSQGHVPFLAAQHPLSTWLKSSLRRFTTSSLASLQSTPHTIDRDLFPNLNQSLQVRCFPLFLDTKLTSKQGLQRLGALNPSPFSDLEGVLYAADRLLCVIITIFTHPRPLRPPLFTSWMYTLSHLKQAFPSLPNQIRCPRYILSGYQVPLLHCRYHSCNLHLLMLSFG